MQKNTIVTFAGISSTLVFAARGIQMFVADSPYRILLWDETLMRPILEKCFSMSWENWTTNLQSETLVAGLAFCSGLLFFAAAVGSLLLVKLGRGEKAAIIYSKPIVCAALILLLSQYLMYAGDRSNHATEFMEYGLQWGSPLLLLAAPCMSDMVINRYARAMVAIVFFAHGLYACDYFYTPWTYISYVMNGLAISEASARSFLLIVGITDMLLSVLIFSRRIFRYSIFWFIIWGLLTTLARMYCNWNSEMWQISFQQYFHEMLVRSPHFLMPLALWIDCRKRQTVNFI